MEQRRLGTTDVKITPVRYGASAIGGGAAPSGWGPRDDSDSIAAIRRAIDLGANWIDTAAIYGLGRSEEVAAAALKDLPESERPHVFTKSARASWSSGPAPRACCRITVRRHGSDRLQPDAVRAVDRRSPGC